MGEEAEKLKEAARVAAIAFAAQEWTWGGLGYPEYVPDAVDLYATVRRLVEDLGQGESAMIRTGRLEVRRTFLSEEDAEQWQVSLDLARWVRPCLTPE